MECGASSVVMERRVRMNLTHSLISRMAVRPQSFWEEGYLNSAIAESGDGDAAAAAAAAALAVASSAALVAVF